MNFLSDRFLATGLKKFQVMIQPEFCSIFSELAFTSVLNHSNRRNHSNGNVSPKMFIFMQIKLIFYTKTRFQTEAPGYKREPL